MTNYVLFEGLDLAGKSTAVKNFMKHNTASWDLREKSIAGANPIRDTAVALKKDERFTDATMGYLHYTSFLADLDTFEAPTTPTVQESVTAFRSIAFHTVLGDPDLAAAFRKHTSSLDIFSHSFLLTASIEARQQRLEQRIKERPQAVSFMDELVRQEPRKFLEMEKVLIDAVHEAVSSLVIIDSSELSPRGVTSAAISEVQDDALFEHTYLFAPTLAPSASAVA